MKRSIQITGLVIMLIGVLGMALPAFAGGWAVATLDSLPGQVVAGRPFTIGFVVRQHGTNPLDGLNPAIRIARPNSNGEVAAFAENDGAGHYTATFTIPEAGEWNWYLETGFFPDVQPMPALTVVTGSGAVTTSVPISSSSPLPYVLGIVSVLGVSGGLFALARTKSPWAAAVTLLAALVGVVGFASTTMRATASASAVVAQPQPEVSQEELGQQLFIAKGCVVCHTHDTVKDVKKTIAFNFDDAPNLTDYSAKDDYLAKWLDDPQAIKPGTYMPKLNLSDAEVGALVVFINAP